MTAGSSNRFDGFSCATSLLTAQFKHCFCRSFIILDKKNVSFIYISLFIFLQNTPQLQLYINLTNVHNTYKRKESNSVFSRALLVFHLHRVTGNILIGPEQRENDLFHLSGTRRVADDEV